jgi:hypothetical protein
MLIDAVGMEAHGTSVDALYDRAKMAMFMATDRLHALRQAIQTLPERRYSVHSGRLWRLIG